MRSDIEPGATFPDYELPDHTDIPRKLSELQGEDPLILTLARGHYCPKEHQQHLGLAAFQSKVAVAYTQIVTIATDEHHTLQEFRASVGAQWTFLSDPGRIVQKDLDIQEYTDPQHDPMIPHTLVLKPGLVIHSIYNGYWFWGRPSIDDLWRDLRAASSEIRPDWDLSKPGSARPGRLATTRPSMAGTNGARQPRASPEGAGAIPRRRREMSAFPALPTDSWSDVGSRFRFVAGWRLLNSAMKGVGPAAGVVEGRRVEVRTRRATARRRALVPDPTDVGAIQCK